MIKTPLSTMIGGAGIWTPGATTIGAFGAKKTFNQLIKSLFANNEQGFAYDPNDLSTMFQDAAGTVPVTAAGQPVGLILDKSGRNNHAYQTTSASRPVLRQNATTGANYLEFDGSDDFLQTSNIDFTATDKVTVIASVHKPQNQIGYILELSADADNSNGAFKITSGSTNNTVFVSRGTAVASTVRTNAVPADIIITAKSRISNSSMTLTTNNGSPATSAASQGVGNYGNYPLYIGRRGGTTLPFNGHIYGLIGIGKLTSDNETAAIEKFIAKRVGVTLNV